MVSPADMEINFTYVKNTSKDIKSFARNLERSIDGLNWALSDIDSNWVSPLASDYMNRFRSVNESYKNKLCSIINMYSSYLDECVEAGYIKTEEDVKECSNDFK